MAQYALCSVCGKGTKVSRARSCTYCGRYVCRQHRINGLCPLHTTVMSKSQADELLKQDNIIHWMARITVPLLFFAFLFSFVIINKENRIIGFISLGIFLVTLTIDRIIFKTADNIRKKILIEVIYPPEMQIIAKSIVCLKCKLPLPTGTKRCTTCGNKVYPIGSKQFQKELKAYPASSAKSAPYPDLIDEQQIDPPQQTPSPHTYHQQSIPPPPPVEQQQYPLPPPPPPSSIPQQKPLPPPPETPTPPPPPLEPLKDTPQEFDSLLDELVGDDQDTKVEVTGFYDEATASGFHICTQCKQKFSITGNTTKCPYCQNPLYGTR